MRGSRQTRWVAGAGVLALALSACGSGEGDEGGGGSDGGETSGSVTVNGCDPENPFIPANTNETCGGNPLDQVFTGLVTYNPETAEAENAIAASIEPNDDSTEFTVTLNEGWTFHDGTPITAASFVDAWNFSAYGPNAYLNSYFFEPIEGFADVQGEDANGDEIITPDEASAEEMSGLEVVSDTEFIVTLESPGSQFPIRLGYTAFSPLPESFFDAPEAFGDSPIGSGPFEFVSFEPNRSIKLTAFEDYQGRKPSVKDVEYKIYGDLDAAYADLLAGNLDILEDIPTSALADATYESDLGEGKFANMPIGVIQTISLPLYVEAYADPDLAKAISMAIDREAVIEVAFPGRIAATSFAAPVVNGYVQGACGSVCEFDPAGAKELFDSTGFEGPLTLSYNADGDHKTWTEAACQSISDALAVECVATPVVDFATFRSQINADEMTGLFRTGWQMDYPSIENFLVPLYATGASANDGGYSNPEFDALLEEAAALEGDEAVEKYQEAEALLFEDLPVIPLWYNNLAAGWSDNVDVVPFTPFGVADLTGVTLA